MKIISFIIIFAFSYSSSVFSHHKIAIFAGGCFWCMEEAFEKIEGVEKVISGYTGGTTKNPTYEEVSQNKTGHYEAVLVSYKPSKVSYEKLLDIFWKNIDPYNNKGQFCDFGSSYLSAIFYKDENQKKIIENSKKKLKNINTRQIQTKIIKVDKFYLAESYHQDYYKKNPFRYGAYKIACGREKRLKEIWQK